MNMETYFPAVETDRDGDSRRRKVIAPHSFANLTTLTSVTLPSSLHRNREPRICRSNWTYREVTIPENTQVARHHAFADCTNLYPDQPVGRSYHHIRLCLCKLHAGITSIHLPDSITTMDIKFFGGCSNLEDANYPQLGKQPQWKRSNEP